jgi:hypothetical protein
MVFVIFVASASCALIVGWGLNLLGFQPFPLLGNVVLTNNFVTATALGPLTLRVLYPRVKSGGFLYADHVPGRPRRSPVGPIVLALAATFAIGGHLAGNLIYTGRWTPPWVAVFAVSTPSRAFEVGVGLAPFVVGLFVCILAL